MPMSWNMFSASPKAGGKSSQPRPVPSIKACISASSTILDLSSVDLDPFVVSIDLVLDHTCPITFHCSAIGILDGTVMHEEGLVFRDTLNGQDVQCDRTLLCYLTDAYNFNRCNESGFITLYPGKRHTVETKLYWSPDEPLPAMDSSEWDRDRDSVGGDSIPDACNWHNSKYLEDGRTYEIGVHGKELSTGWMEGTKADLLAWSFIRPVKMSKEIVPIQVVQTAEFSVQRPDISGGPEWSKCIRQVCY